MSRTDIGKLARIFSDFSDLCIDPIIMIEKPLLMPGQNVSSTFNNGKSHGIVLTLIQIFFPGVKVVVVSSKEWQEAMITDRTFVISKIRRDRRKQLKLDSVAAAQKLFPDFDFKKNKKSKVDSDGMTDSALIAMYCYQNFK